jgi:two-component system response regulator PilR (NtrC family)
MTLCEGEVIKAEDLHLPDTQQAEEEEEETSGEYASEAVLSLDPMLVEKEKEVITRALEKTRYNKTAAAKLLGISFRQLRYRIKKLGIE